MPLHGPQYWLIRAERAKELAAAIHDRIIQRQLRDIGRNYEIIAEQCTKLGIGEEAEPGRKRE